jgi:predicted nucleic acid-binding protein
MILVDTSAWIEVLKGRAGDRFRNATVDDEVVTCLPIVQEVLQGN